MENESQLEPKTASLKASHDFHMVPGHQLFIQFQGFPTRLKSTFIGCQQNAYIIITIPNTVGIDSMLYEGTPVTVTYLHNGVIYGFRSDIIYRLVSPARILFISFPKNIEKHELRKHHRVECNIPTKVKIENTETPFEGIMVDISMDGCKVVSLATSEKDRENLRPGIAIFLSFTLVGIGGVKVLKGILKNYTVENERFTLGVSFKESADDGTLEKVGLYIQSVLKFHFT